MAIAEKQDQLMQAQLVRRAIAEMRITQGTPISGGRTLCRLYVVNRGNRTVSDYTWEFICPVTFFDYLNIRLDGQKLENELQAIPAGVLVRVLTGHRTVPVYPKRESELGTIEFKQLPSEYGNMQFLWKVSCEDGSFPEDRDWGHVTVKLY
jgi:hypothetical protein